MSLALTMPNNSKKNTRAARIAPTAAAMYENGLSLEAIAKELGIAYRTARKAVTSQGVTLRDPSTRLIGRTRPDKKGTNHMNLELTLKQFGAASEIQQFAREVVQEIGSGTVGETGSYISWTPEGGEHVAIYFHRRKVSFAVPASQAQDFLKNNAWAEDDSKKRNEAATNYVQIEADHFDVASVRTKALGLAKAAAQYRMA